MTRATGTIGILALQGGFDAHAVVLTSLGATVREVRRPDELNGLAALVLPGGESTTMMLGIEREALAEPLAAFVRGGRPVLATCAGAIILDDARLGLLDVTCERNAYGGQAHSFEADLEIAGLAGGSFRGVFIRAPRFVRTGEGVETFATHAGEPVAVRAGNVLAISFHPELAADDRVHRLFLDQIAASKVTDINQRKKAA
ncbi:MAG: pyridoxal 5'-phosphate synthase glutaminase subunit PdxT [Thermoleophilia bacterium]|nr:pyridoxal 5'-phosphate synthase glutaminase subunit PdxT [Thermoleophilia bacterium]